MQIRKPYEHGFFIGIMIFTKIIYIYFYKYKYLLNYKLNYFFFCILRFGDLYISFILIFKLDQNIKHFFQHMIYHIISLS